MPKFLVREDMGFGPNPEFVNTARTVEADSPAQAVETATGCPDLVEAEQFSNKLANEHSWFFVKQCENGRGASGGVNVFGPLA